MKKGKSRVGVKMIKSGWFLYTSFYLLESPKGDDIKVRLNKKTPANRIRTSDLRITVDPLQSSALPTELSRVVIVAYMLSIYTVHVVPVYLSRVCVR